MFYNLNKILAFWTLSSAFLIYDLFVFSLILCCCLHLCWLLALRKKAFIVFEFVRSKAKWKKNRGLVSTTTTKTRRNWLWWTFFYAFVMISLAGWRNLISLIDFSDLKPGLSGSPGFDPIPPVATLQPCFSKASSCLSIWIDDSLQRGAHNHIIFFALPLLRRSYTTPRH